MLSPFPHSCHSKTRGRRLRKAKRRLPSHGATCLPWCYGASRKVGNPSQVVATHLGPLFCALPGPILCLNSSPIKWGEWHCVISQLQYINLVLNQYINLDALECMHLKPVIWFGFHLTIFIHVTQPEWLMHPFFSFFFSWSQWKYPVLCQLCFITLKLTDATFGIP